jgi:hypothetical protein
MTANAATAKRLPWQVGGEMLKWIADGKPVKFLIPIAVGVTAAQLPAKKHSISPAFCQGWRQ